MGPDQYAYVKTPESGDEGESPKFVWRKHSKLQTFMEGLYTERTGLSASDLNCGELKLETADIDTLEQAVKGGALPHCEGGFFYGISFKTSRPLNTATTIWSSALGRGPKSHEGRP